MPQPVENAVPLTAPDAETHPDTRLEPIPTPHRRQPPRDYALCRHIKTTGHRCGSPALRGEHFCYFHHTARRPPKHLGVHPDHAVFTMPLIEDGPSILGALRDVLARVAADSLNHRRAALLLCGLRIACITQRLAIPQPPAASDPYQDSPDTEDPSLELVQDIVMDPELGPLAPIAHGEFPEPTAPGQDDTGPYPDDHDLAVERMYRTLRRLGVPYRPPVPRADPPIPIPIPLPDPDSGFNTRSSASSKSLPE